METPAPPGMAKGKGLLTPSSKFSYSIVTGSHPKNPQRADCFCWCSTGLILLILKDFVVGNRDGSLLWSQLLFSVELQQEFYWQLLDLCTQNHATNECVMPFTLHVQHWRDNT